MRIIPLVTSLSSLVVWMPIRETEFPRLFMSADNFQKTDRHFPNGAIKCPKRRLSTRGSCEFDIERFMNYSHVRLLLRLVDILQSPAMQIG